jgi:hypothetical protein
MGRPSHPNMKNPICTKEKLKCNHCGRERTYHGAMLRTTWIPQCQQLLSILSTVAQSSSMNHHGGSHPTSTSLSGMDPLDNSFWILDSGATDHMVRSPLALSSSFPVHDRIVQLPNDTHAPVTHVGSIIFSRHLILTDVLCVPTFHFNLISVSKLCHTIPCLIAFFSHFRIIQDLRSMKMIGMGTECDGLYYFNKTKEAHCNLTTRATSQLWYRRLGHLSNKIMRFLSNNVVEIEHLGDDPCFICPLAKQTQLSFPPTSISSVQPFELLHTDIWGDYRVPSTSGACYILTIVDGYTRCTWVYLMNHKSDTRSILQSFIQLIETQFSATVKHIRSDNGSEFDTPSYYSSKGIIHQTICVSTSQQNGVAKRKHHHLLNVSRALLFQANLPKHFWGDTVLIAAYLINRTPTPRPGKQVGSIGFGFDLCGFG